MIPRQLAICSFLALAALGGCAAGEEDPFKRANTWAPTGVNEANLRAHIVNPNDLVVGQSARGGHAILANAAATRLLSDRVKQLAKVTTSGLAGGGESGGGAGGGNTGLGASGGGTQQ